MAKKVPKDTLRDLGEMWQRIAAKQAVKKKATAAKKKLTDRTPGPMRVMNETAYIAENGLDREDAAARRQDRRAFQADVNRNALKNTMTALQQGRMYKDYSLLEANRRSKTIPSKKK